jgi:hypothetical protein
MKRSLSSKVLWVSYVLFALIGAVSPAQSRIWSRNPTNLAQDYLVINDNRGHGELVMLIWIASPMMPNEPANQMARELLDKYVVVGVVHAHSSKEGIFTFDQVADIQVDNEDNQPLNLLDTNTTPPAIVGALATLQSVFGRALGPMGQGVHWFAFDSGSVRACTKGGVSVSFADEKYTYDTPVPGCP